MNNYTITPNELLEKSSLSVIKRYLIIVLLKHCGKKDRCFPSQKTLAREIGRSERYVRKLLRELKEEGIICVCRTGFNRSNTYKISKDLITRNCSSSPNPLFNKNRSSHIGTAVPLHIGNKVPPNSNYIKEKDNNNQNNLDALNNCREELKKKGFFFEETKNKEIMPIR